MAGEGLWLRNSSPVKETQEPLEVGVPLLCRLVQAALTSERHQVPTSRSVGGVYVITAGTVSGMCSQVSPGRT